MTVVSLIELQYMLNNVIQEKCKLLTSDGDQLGEKHCIALSVGVTLACFMLALF